MIITIICIYIIITEKYVTNTVTKSVILNKIFKIGLALGQNSRKI